MSGDTSAPLLADLFDEGVHAASAGLDYGPDALHPEERRFVERAVASRQREFSTGRVLARRLLARVGSPVEALGRDDDRVPRWPEGVVGSISHCAGLCVVALAPRSRQRGVGVDVEPDEPVAEGIERVVCRGGEHAWLDEAADAEERARRIKLVFSVKEATYKAFYPELRTFWSFQDVEVEMDLTRGRFLAQLPEGPDVRAVEGRVARRSGWIVSTVCRGPAPR
ncbi:MAG: 4'-phosphopantetheinyl transferase superfamily protein [Spirochaetaceae bacterium]|nr:4'-phosphopantetheinyl transferase superfamily protein [Myxococcales bacterium]MCB9725332.1 4'-phosphopantetheinyl transferase superfamily protein [Spirochaetaceae bacterium]HPG27028.1 4'-phosphopantetheinyl transferase superfamily protein [Myxococcota bacterium]